MIYLVFSSRGRQLNYVLVRVDNKLMRHVARGLEVREHILYIATAKEFLVSTKYF
jgi:hypothetical protein